MLFCIPPMQNYTLLLPIQIGMLFISKTNKQKDLFNMSQEFTIIIETGNAAFDEAPDHAVEDVLAQVKDMVIGRKNCGKLYDFNGNHVGSVTFK